MKELRAEYAKLLCEKKAAYPEYYKAKSEYRDLLTYQANLAGLFSIENVRAEQQKERQHEEKQALEQCAAEDAIFVRWGLGLCLNKQKTWESAQAGSFCF